jgi:aspartyl/glutamyl-tRNA(Asn/Gln) amidotransferase C subunit
LARIEIDEKDAPKFRKDVTSIMHFLHFLRNADFGGETVEPLYSPVQRYNLFDRRRSDTVTEGNDATAVLQNAKNTKANLFVVPGRNLGES